MALTPGSEAWAYTNYGNPDSPGYVASTVISIDFCGRTMRVHRKAARHFLWLARCFKENSPSYAAHIAQGTLDDWSYANRFVAGTTVKSNHSFGIAIDINALENARGTPGNMPTKVVQAAMAQGFGWGGSWSYPDSMHFEEHLTPMQIRLRFRKDGKPRFGEPKPKPDGGWRPPPWWRRVF